MFDFLKRLFGFGKSKAEEPEPDRRSEVAESSSVISAIDPMEPLPQEATPEELCELTDGMTHEEMHAQLAKLYRRHNRAASSLNPELRQQAERMLDAIVQMRHRYLDGIED